MGSYSYKDVVNRQDFQDQVTAWEAYNGCECDGDPNYDGDYWDVVSDLLDVKDRERDELKARVEELERKALWYDTINEICEKLSPHHYIEIHLENGFGGVTLCGHGIPIGGKEVEMDMDDEDPFYSAMKNCFNLAEELNPDKEAGE